MPQKPDSLDEIAQHLGFEDEDTMLIELYTRQGWSISELSKKIGYSYANMRNRLLRRGIELRGRGGDNRPTIKES